MKAIKVFLIALFVIVVLTGCKPDGTTAASGSSTKYVIETVDGTEYTAYKRLGVMSTAGFVYFDYQQNEKIEVWLPIRQIKKITEYHN